MVYKVWTILYGSYIMQSKLKALLLVFGHLSHQPEHLAAKLAEGKPRKIWLGLGNRKSFRKNVQALSQLPIKSQRNVSICSLSEFKFSFTSYKTGSNIDKVASRPNQQEKSMDHFLLHLKNWRISYKKWTDNFLFQKLKVSCWKMLLLLLKQHWENNKFWTIIKLFSYYNKMYSRKKLFIYLTIYNRTFIW